MVARSSPSGDRPDSHILTSSPTMCLSKRDPMCFTQVEIMKDSKDRDDLQGSLIHSLHSLADLNPPHAEEKLDSPNTYSKSYLLHQFSSSSHQRAGLQAWWEGRTPWKGNTIDSELWGGHVPSLFPVCPRNCMWGEGSPSTVIREKFLVRQQGPSQGAKSIRH